MQNHSSRIWLALEQHERRLGAGDGWHSAYDSLGREKAAAPGFGMRDMASQLSRVERVRQALADSGELARHLIATRLSGISLAGIWDILLATCEDIALYYGGSVVAGAAVGAAGGAFLGGVGAIPGAAVGATAGAQVGSWVMAALGLKSLAEGLATAIPDALHYYERGFREAWGPAPQTSQSSIQIYSNGGNVRHAAFEFANGHVAMIAAILTALMAYLSRGRGSKGVVLQEIRESRRLGPRIAQWVEDNEQRLANHPALQSRRNNVAASPAEEPGAPPPKRGRQPDEGDPRRAPAGMPQKKVPCFQPNDLPQASYPEFDRQLAGQEAGLNDMTVEEYVRGREAYGNGSAKRDRNVAQSARDDYKKDLVVILREQFEKTGMSPRQAKLEAQEAANKKMSTLAALHNPDMIAGGKDVINGFGDRGINSRIGPQWKSRVGALDQAAAQVPAAMRSHVKINAKLERCK
ncbi:polymorphic toxin type 15 domain-containing protein [Pseudoduganella ginsengisoli]|uniref:Uncharacterized protein n=1 Tax=Pseudoduganella ginsengisoli TaxID=1462440 RepID=A0A6L6PYJ1_9BURK|nr:polymorphic toxin type 15 domain-containing protein [Pseudoduganella ginsengisoli]MTW02229.1 hypothetical protein [Pseudoduganella ginsengisoli]